MYRSNFNEQYLPANTNRWVEWFFGAGLFFSVATTLRSDGLGAGISDFFFVPMIFLAMLRSSEWFNVPKKIMGNLSVIAVSFSLGLFFNFLLLNNLNSSILHNIVSYLYCVSIMFSLLLFPQKMDKIIAITFLAGTLFYFSVQIFQFHRLFLHFRFQGLSVNPNQLALFFCPAPFVLLDIYRKTQEKHKKILIAGVLFLSVIVGINTFSKAIIASWGAGVIIVLFSYNAKSSGTRLLKTLFNLFIGIVLILVISGLALYLVGNLDTMLQALFNTQYQNESTIRFKLWSYMYQVLVLSPIFGLGPGSYIDLFEGNLQGHMESHNNFCDLFTQGGLIGLLAYINIVFSIIRDSLRARNTYLLSIFLPMITFSMFHLVLRQPLFWFILIYCYLKLEMSVRD